MSRGIFTGRSGRATGRTLLSRRRAGRLATLIAITTALVLPGALLQPAQAADPTYTITIDKGAFRQADGTVSSLQGATFDLYQVTASDALTGGTLVGSCTTGAAGTCAIQVTTSTSNPRFYAVETSAPAGWSIATNWGTATELMRWNTGRMDSGRTSATLPTVGRWPNVYANDTAPTRCGINVLMILDQSGSIDATEMTNFKNAAKGVIDSLSGTPSRVAISTFAAQASSPSALTLVPGNVGALKGQIDALPAQGSGNTNWDEALSKAAESGEYYDVALLLTDGDPTRSRLGDGNAKDTLVQAIPSANALKARTNPSTGKRTHVMAVGIGLTGAGPINRLKLVSSDSAAYTSTWQGLGPVLGQLAAGTCNDRVTIQKVVQDVAGNPVANSADANGWNFTGTTSAGSLGSGGTFPATAAVNGVNGFTSLPLDVSAGSTPTVTINEQLASGWDYRGAVCKVDGNPVTTTPVGATGFKFTGKAGSAMSCEVTNRKLPDPPQLTLKKVLKDHTGAATTVPPGVFTLSATGASLGFSGDANSAAVTDKVVAAGTQYVLGETGPANGYAYGSTWSCTKDGNAFPVTGGNKVTLAGGDKVTCAVTNQVKLADLTLTKTTRTAFNREWTWAVDKEVVGPDRVVVNGGGQASFDYKVTVTPTGKSPTDHTVSGSITVHNPNPVAVSGVTLSDTLPGATCSVVNPGQITVPANGSATRDYTCAFAAAPAATGTNTAKATWNAAGYNGTSGQATGQQAYDFADATVTPTNKVVKVVDSQVVLDPAFPGGVQLDAADGARSFTYSKSFTAPSGTCRSYDNTATVTPLAGTEVLATDSASVTACGVAAPSVTVKGQAAATRTFAWSLAKDVDRTKVTVGENGAAPTFTYTVDVTAGASTYSGHTMSGQVQVRNNLDYSAISVNSIALTSSHGGGATCSLDAAPSGSIAAGATGSYPWTCAFTGTPALSGQVSADVSWTPTGGTARTTPGSQDVDFAVTEVGRTVDVRDTMATPTLLGQVTWSGAGEVTPFTYTKQHDAQVGACASFDNDAWVDLDGNGTRATGEPQDSTSATVCRESVPEVSVSADAAVTRTFAWDVAKNVDKTSVELGQGSAPATFHYTVDATAGDDSWSGRTLTGTVKVENTNYDPVTVSAIDLSTTYGGGTACAVTSPLGGSIAAGGSRSFDYSCTFAGPGQPSASGTVDAEVTWASADGPGGTVSGSRSENFDVTEVGRTVAVHDSMATPTLLGQATWTAKGEVVPFTYDRSLDATAGTCSSHDNDAWVDSDGDGVWDATEPGDSKTVKVCREQAPDVSLSASGDQVRTFNWDLAKKVDRTRADIVPGQDHATFSYTVTLRAGAAVNSDFRMAGTLHVTNPNQYADGAVVLTGATVATTLGGGASCEATLPADPTVAVGGSLDLPVTCTFTGEPAQSGQVTGSVTWDPAGPAASATAAAPATPITLGVRRTVGEKVQVVDDKTTGTPVDLGTPVTWSEGLVRDFTYTLDHTVEVGRCGQFTNNAWIEDGSVIQAARDGGPSTTVKVCRWAEPESTLAAKAQLDRAYGWSVDKVADATVRSVDPATGRAAFTYTVTARATTATDSGWKVTGEVAVSNPNTFADGDLEVELAPRTSLGGGSTCTVAGGAGFTLPDSSEGPSSVTRSFSCSFTSAPSASGAVVVGVSARSAAFGPIVREASVPVAFGLASETNKVVDVVDDKTVPGQRVVLESGLTWLAGLVRTYTYTLALPGGQPGTSAQHRNTATVDQPSGPDPQASTTVTVNTPEILPEQSYGKATGRVRASCQGTVRAKLRNNSGERVTYVLKVGRVTKRFKVASLDTKQVQAKGPAHAKVVLKAGGKVLDRVRIPARCQAPDELPETGLRASALARFVSALGGWLG